MLKFLLWKVRRFLLFINRKGFRGFLTHFGKKFLDKLHQIFRAPFRSLLESQNRSRFLEEWDNSQSAAVPRPAFRVLLLVSSFFDMIGNEYQQGGAERYVLELNGVIQQIGGRLEVYQCGKNYWHRIFQGIPIYGLPTDGQNTENLNRIFHIFVPRGQITIYFQMTLSAPLCHTPSICVSHGIDWDAPWLQHNHTQYRQTIARVLSSIRNVSVLVSVDTNTLNWLRATDADLAKKGVYIPNFVDSDFFRDLSKPSLLHDGFVILYPRRLSEARGFWLLAKIIPKLLASYPQLRIHFCGKAEPIEKAEVDHICAGYPDRVRWFDVPPEEMPSVYNHSDLVIIPTRYSEGTSLACLEALASEKPVIATNVGGLPDLILSGYNGLLVEPDEKDLLDAIIYLINNPTLRERLARNGLETAQAFHKSIWQSRWSNLLQGMLTSNNLSG